MLVSLSCSKCSYQFACKNICCRHILWCVGVGGSVFDYYLPGMVEMVAPDCGRRVVTFFLWKDIAERSMFQVDKRVSGGCNYWMPYPMVQGIIECRLFCWLCWSFTLWGSCTWILMCVTLLCWNWMHSVICWILDFDGCFMKGNNISLNASGPRHQRVKHRQSIGIWQQLEMDCWLWKHQIGPNFPFTRFACPGHFPPHPTGPQHWMLGAWTQYC